MLKLRLDTKRYDYNTFQQVVQEIAGGGNPNKISIIDMIRYFSFSDGYIRLQ